ncbi:LysR family transcriptional regulator [Pseudoalteromonas piscicida]|uniref:LysR family transcriptional regulator n=1 Tax=Pseudoalteromonas piscicida TaxID=43662 RepID=A0AAQ2ETW7_PSEO7|nr:MULTISPECIES: LysR family transcriptional regulator [Pseudoalteromonas]KJY85716.1 LysR family transcriptional regulator [Pseudoalteromonas piscicida]MDP4486713.1 LysR family transcriptional regulator [Pseudoalteromonas piscicida]TMN35099.1 LysR family transcriptional regulator [Pseudoalteromonas piscicida]TMN36174.1 LysR family transcriptional regulator [Pseudoalteromonas piscicida]TMN47448.1 LysR family transcriptional regulator [Pseudoalteromonas piscicida]
MHWTLDQLEAFVTAVRLGSFSAAARHLGKAQSRVSTAIANLEADLGFALFDRSARLPVLNQAGLDLFKEAEAVLMQCQRLQSRANSLNSGEEVSLTVAMDEAVPIIAFESLFERLAQQFPLLKLAIINGSQDDIAQWVSAKRAEIGILFHQKPLPESLDFTSINSFKQILICSPHHPLAQHSAPSIEELNRHRQLVIRDRIGNTQSQAISTSHWHIDSYYYIMGLVIRGVGWALVPEHVVNTPWYMGELFELSTEHIPNPLVVEMGIVQRRDQSKGPIVQWLYNETANLF